MAFQIGDYVRLTPQVSHSGSEAKEFVAKRKPKQINGVWHYLIGGVFDLPGSELQPDPGPLPAGYVDVPLSSAFDGSDLIFDKASIGVVTEVRSGSRYLVTLYTSKISKTAL